MKNNTNGLQHKYCTLNFLIPYVLDLLAGFTMEGKELCYSSLGPHSCLLCLHTDLLKQCLRIFFSLRK